MAHRRIPIARPLIGNEEIEAVTRVLRSGMLAQGREVELFEREFAEYIGARHAIAVANGTLALDTALKALGIREGDEVITTPFTFIATANAILYQRARPVFADIDPRTYNLNPDRVLEKITHRTRAIIVVHLYGQPADMKAFTEIAEDHHLLLVEDAAQAHGAEFLGKKVGSFGHAAIFSFYPTKNMTTGEGGIIVTDDDEVARKARLIRDHGQERKYLHVVLGYNYRMTNIAAAIGRVQLRKLDTLNEVRRRNAEILTRELKGLRGIIPPYEDPRGKHVYHQYVVRVTAEAKLSRDELVEKLREKGIETAIHYPVPIHKQPLYRELGLSECECPNAEEAARTVLSLPVHPALSREDLAYIASAMRELLS